MINIACFGWGFTPFTSIYNANYLAVAMQLFCFALCAISFVTMQHFVWPFGPICSAYSVCEAFRSVSANQTIVCEGGARNDGRS